MKHTLLVSEGPDDLKAIHEILERQMGLKVQRPPTPWFDQARERVFQQPGAERTVHVMHTNGRDPAAKLCQDYLREGKILQRQIDRLGLIFDPDTHKNDEWRRWFKQHALGDLTAQEQELGYLIDSIWMVSRSSFCLYPGTPGRSSMTWTIAAGASSGSRWPSCSTAARRIPRWCSTC